MATSSTNLWQGNVSLRTGMFVKYAYAEISTQEIEIRKNSRDDSAVLYRIAPSQITSITTGKNNFSEIFVRGYQGFIIEFQNEGNKGKVRFWPKGFGQYPNSTETPKFGAALSKFCNIPVETLMTEKMANSQQLVAITAVLVISVIACGALPGAILAASVYGAMMLWEKETMDKNLRKILAILLVAGAVGFAFLINFLVLLARLES